MKEHQTGQVATSAADVYEQFFVPALFAPWPQHVLRAANVQPGDAVLDVACGTGILARETAVLVGPTGAVTGVDINDGMLAVARRVAPHIAWKRGAAENLPFDDEAFDRVVSQFGLMFFADPIKAIGEMRRVLRPGGTAAIAVWGRLADTPGYAMVAEILGELFGAEAAESIQAPYSLGDKETLADLFARAGVANVDIQTMHGQVRFPSIEAWIHTDIKGWTLADTIDDEGYVRLQRDAPTKLARFARPDGSVSFAAPAHIVTIHKSK